RRCAADRPREMRRTTTRRRAARKSRTSRFPAAQARPAVASARRVSPRRSCAHRERGRHCRSRADRRDQRVPLRWQVRERFSSLMRRVERSQEDVVMFETSVVKARVVAQRRYGVLSASLAVHTIVIIAVVAFSLGSVSLPKNAPKELASFISLPVVPLPMPQGRRDAPHRENPPPQQHAAATPRAQTAPPENVTPARVPDSIPTIPTGSGDTTNANTNNVGDNERYGDPNGDPHVKDIGQETPGPAIPDVVYQPGLEV